MWNCYSPNPTVTEVVITEPTEGKFKSDNTKYHFTQWVEDLVCW